MSKLNQIQNALKELDGGVFQKLWDCYLKEIGYTSLNPLGSVLGSNKVRKGTPDTVIKNDNGKFVFVEYTTQQNNLFKKLGSDIDKCCNEKKTGIKNSDIEKIILCYTGRLTPKEEQNLYQKIDGTGISLKLYDIEGLSFDLYYNFPGLAKDFLGISIDTGQILTPNDFVSSYDSNKFSTPLNTDFYFRKNEIKQALSQLHSNRLLLISGKAGIGKSRLTLEIIRQFQNEHPGYKVYCVRDRGQDLFEDLRVYFSKPAKFLILIDDANRISKFDYVIHLLHDCKQEQEFKIIATVRDYAIERIRNSAQSIDDKSEIFLLPFEKSELKELIGKLFGITNNLWLDRICDIAAGNPRLAMMAAKTAIAANSLESIRDISSLYDQYFSSIKSDLQELNNPDMLRVAGIISFFRTLDKTNEKLMESIYTAFSIDENRLWQSIQRLHELELVDIYENQVVKISDQVLSTYLFYLCVFKNKVISLKVILEQFFPSQINRIRDAIYPCLNSFDYEQLANQIKPVISEQWSKYKKNNQDDKLHQLIQAFCFFCKLKHCRTSMIKYSQ
ncbi:TPA: ATP-binding protein [Legionella pneumophila]|nr:ATP-binding protein [Legionella pneumophila]HDV5807099.1 ATP-binding protein [Legionella pneumophila]